MTDRYVGSGGSDSNDGLTWANRKLTLNGVEDTPVVAGDTVYVAPGLYTETLTCDVSGSSGNPITYIADVSGINTDGIGGPVVITGSDDNRTLNRANCITVSSGITYRTFTGFHIVTFERIGIDLAGDNENCTLTDIAFEGFGTYQSDAELNASIRIVLSSSTGTGIVVNRIFIFGGYNGILITAGSDKDISGMVLNNIVAIASYYALNFQNVHTFTVKNSSIFCNRIIYQIQSAITHSYMRNMVVDAIQVNSFPTNSYIFFYDSMVNANLIGFDSSNVTDPCFNSKLPLLTGEDFPVKFPQSPLLGEVNKDHWSIGQDTTSAASDDLFGTTRPTTSTKKTWGAFQFSQREKELTTVRTGKASVKLIDAGRMQFFLPVDGTSTTVSTYVYREANYAGTLPQMVIYEHGQSARTTVDTGSASQWNELTDTFTPQSTSDYVVVELVSNNTATSGSYAAFFDDLIKEP